MMPPGRSLARLLQDPETRQAELDRLRNEMEAVRAERFYCREMPAVCGTPHPETGSPCLDDAGHETPHDWPPQPDTGSSQE